MPWLGRCRHLGFCMIVFLSRLSSSFPGTAPHVSSSNATFVLFATFPVLRIREKVFVIVKGCKQRDLLL